MEILFHAHSNGKDLLVGEGGVYGETWIRFNIYEPTGGRR